MAEVLARALRAMARDGRGNVALIVALLLPMLLVVSMGGIELNQVLSDKRTSQNVADSAALMGAAQLGVTPSGADQRAQAFALAQLAGISHYASVSVAATVSGSSMTVAVDTQRASFFGSLFPPGGFHTHVSSTATGVNTVPLCVLGLTPSFSDMIHVTGTSQLQAGACLVHSNTELFSDPLAAIQASANEAGTLALGPITQTASVGAPSVTDPFANLNTNAPSCAGAPNVQYNGTTTQYLNQTRYGSMDISGNLTVVSTPGPHYFCGNLTIGGNATLTGTNTTLIFENSSQFTASGSSTVSLQGAQSGAFAGFVIIADRNESGSFQLNSDHFSTLTGTLYSPTASLVINGVNTAGATTPWTVIAAKNLTVSGGAKLIINANYGGSSVPVPVGVGNNRQNVKLLQ